MKLFLKGILVGIGGATPGLCGTVLLLIFGLYRRTLDALASLFTDFRNSARFLAPLLAGMGLGLLAFGRIVDHFLSHHELPTRFLFLGLILGALPSVWKEVRKEGFPRYCWGLILLSLLAGVCLFGLNPNAFPQIPEPNGLQSILLGVAVAFTSIVPGAEPAVILSTLGLYEAYMGALAAVDLSVLLPMLLGLALGAVGVSAVMGWLFRRFYTVTFCILFGIFLSMIPSILPEGCSLQPDLSGLVSLALVPVGFLLSWLFSRTDPGST